jgi:hypothetical protein
MYCFAHHLDYGTRADGNIGEVLPKRSFNLDTPYHVARFFHNFLYFIFIWLILFSILFGIVIDTFAELREYSQKIDYDRKNVCFICDKRRDELENENTNYHTHTTTDHYVWTYVEYIIGLKYMDRQETNAINSYVIEECENKQISWFPSGNKIDNEHTH